MSEAAPSAQSTVHGRVYADGSQTYSEKAASRVLVRPSARGSVGSRRSDKCSSPCGVSIRGTALAGRGAARLRA